MVLNIMKIHDAKSIKRILNRKSKMGRKLPFYEMARRYGHSQSFWFDLYFVYSTQGIDAAISKYQKAAKLNRFTVGRKEEKKTSPIDLVLYRKVGGQR
jgi:hypothetical protein